ncbi:hypothetical protein BH23ACT4_BH23ACT4_00820 [soil metagenome]
MYISRASGRFPLERPGFHRETPTVALPENKSPTWTVADLRRPLTALGALVAFAGAGSSVW